MIVDTPKEEYTELFEKKFRSFCERAPVYLTFSIVYNEVHVKDVVSERRFVFEINLSVPVEEFIGKIRAYLKFHVYPKLTEVKIKNVEPSVEGLMEYTQSEGVSFDEAYSVLAKKKTEVNYVIDKINIKKNQIVIENLKNQNQYLFQMKMPVILFLKKELRKTDNPQDAFLSLQQEGEFLYEIERRDHEKTRMGSREA